jgi:HEAT repeat protein
METLFGVTGGDCRMTDGDDAPEADEGADDANDVTVEDLDERLDAAAEALDEAETESDLDDVEADLDAIETDLEAADLPEPDEDDEDAEDPRGDLESRLSDLRDDLQDQRGPYAADAVDDVETAQSTLRDGEWTERGEGEIVDAVNAFLDELNVVLETDVGKLDGDAGELAAGLDVAIAAIEDADLDADADAETIADLVEATGGLQSGLDDAQEWDDLETHEKLQAEGFYDVLGHYKDYPPEWSALKEWEKRGRVDMVLLAKEHLQSDFMERHCMEALIRMGDPEAFEEMHQLAQRRDKPAIEALGKMGAGAADAVETLVEYVDADSDPQLQKVTLKALGEIGSADAVQPIANKLALDNENVRPHVARALGLLGDTRAVDPLTDALADDDSDEVRAAAAWALRQIGTRDALAAAAEYEDDRSFLVQTEAEAAREALAVESTA